MKVANHILSQEGILTTFQIAKKVSVKDIKKLREKMKAAHIDSSQIDEIIKQSVVADAEKCAKINKIPGLIVGDLGISGVPGTTNTEEEKRVVELTYFSSLIAKKISEKGISKYHSCYIVNAIVNMLGLTDHDFEDFHKRFARFKNGEPPTDEDSDAPTY